MGITCIIEQIQVSTSGIHIFVAAQIEEYANWGACLASEITGSNSLGLRRLAAILVW